MKGSCKRRLPEILQNSSSGAASHVMCDRKALLDPDAWAYFFGHPNRLISKGLDEGLNKRIAVALGMDYSMVSVYPSIVN